MKKKINRKGFGLIAAMMIILVLFIMAAGFFQVTDFSSRSVNSNIRNLQLYWAAESASSYNVNWWVNLPVEVRVTFPSTYTYDTKTVYDDKLAPKTDPAKFAGAAGTTEGSDIYLHMSSLFEGNTSLDNPQLQDVNGNKLLLARYKGPRKGKPEQAVWILDSYAWDPGTGDIANIVLANVYNIKLLTGQGPFQNGELINETNANSGFHGCKGRFNEQDIRYGDCYFGGLVHFDYQTAAVKLGPIFYGLVKSSTTKQSWYKKETNLFPGTSQYSHGLGINDNVANAVAATTTANGSLKGGYAKLVTPLDLSTVTWSWADVESEGAKNGLYFLEPALFSSGDINIVLKTSGGITTADICKGAGSTTPTKTIVIGSSSFKGIAVTEEFGEVGISGVSGEDFTLITQKDRVNIMGDFYLSEMENTKTWVKAAVIAMGPTQPNAAPPALSKVQLEQISNEMLSYNPKGHLAVVAALDASDIVDKTWPPIYIPDEKMIFSTSSYITQYGELGAKGTGPTSLRFYNVGAIMVLEKQTISSGPADTAQKWPKVYIEDERYSREGEPLPPFCGAGPNDPESDNVFGLNEEHVWNKPVVANSKDWRTVVWRNLSSIPQ